MHTGQGNVDTDSQSTMTGEYQANSYYGKGDKQWTQTQHGGMAGETATQGIPQH